MAAGTAAACSLVLAGCSAPAASGSAATPAASTSAHGTRSTALTVTDGTGAKVTVPRPATRFVSLDPSSIEVLKDLGETTIAYDSGDKLFVHDLFGSAAQGMTEIGGSWSSPNISDIIAARPDLVIGDAYPHAELKPALRDVAPMYLISRNGGYRQSMQDFLNLGILTGHEATARHDVDLFEKDLAAAKKKSPDDQTSLIIWGQSPTDFEVPTADDPSASVLGAVSRYPWGGHGAQGMNLSLEKILDVNPDVIFVESLDRLDNPKAQSLSSELASNPVWDRLKAVRDHRVFEVNPEIWHSDRGGLGLKQILDQAMPLLYPALSGK